MNIFGCDKKKKNKEINSLEKVLTQMRCYSCFSYFWSLTSLELFPVKIILHDFF